MAHWIRWTGEARQAIAPTHSGLTMAGQPATVARLPADAPGAEAAFVTRRIKT